MVLDLYEMRASKHAESSGLRWTKQIAVGRNVEGSLQHGFLIQEWRSNPVAFQQPMESLAFKIDTKGHGKDNTIILLVCRVTLTSPRRLWDTPTISRLSAIRHAGDEEPRTTHELDQAVSVGKAEVALCRVCEDDVIMRGMRGKVKTPPCSCNSTGTPIRLWQGPL